MSAPHFRQCLARFDTMFPQSGHSISFVEATAGRGGSAPHPTRHNKTKAIHKYGNRFIAPPCKCGLHRPHPRGSILPCRARAGTAPLNSARQYVVQFAPEHQRDHQEQGQSEHDIDHADQLRAIDQPRHDPTQVRVEHSVVPMEMTTALKPSQNVILPASETPTISAMYDRLKPQALGLIAWKAAAS